MGITCGTLKFALYFSDIGITLKTLVGILMAVLLTHQYVSPTNIDLEVGERLLFACFVVVVVVVNVN